MGRWRMNVSTMMFLVILQGATVVLFCGWYFQFSPCNNPANQNHKVHVLLLSSWRSGSSFLGQVFSQHPSVFYLMEPGWHIWRNLQKPKNMLQIILRDVFRDLFRCEFSGLEAFMPPRSNVSNVFMWSHSRALCSPPACPLTPRGDLSDEHRCSKRCNVSGLKGMESSCKSYSHIVLKEVRFFDLESLYPLLQDPNLDLRIIHLVRDPRAVMRSREESFSALAYDNSIMVDRRAMPPADLQFEVIKKICRSHVLMIERAMLKPQPFLEGRYKLVRYEDLVHNPIGMINDIYQFVGLDLTRKVGEWIYQVTHGKGIGSKSQAFKITSRDAVDVSKAWRTTFPFAKIKRVQELCYGAMKMIGYRPVNNDKDLKNLGIELLAPLEPYEFIWLPSKAGQTADKTKEK
ncbi:carbohydrate sulfotransferase 6 [Brachionichthys hirsutus]|uniref:carbohydrate sulfotransferase 6 n=1 Tax=Brachionichthys hirsutus TaxID=412623 RepID=UPI00360528B8